MKRFSLVLASLFFILASTHAQNTWQQLGGGTSLEVFAVTVYNGNLIAAGIFDTAGTSPVHRIASWNGSTWTPLGNGTTGGLIGLGIVRCLTVFNGDLIAGGYFDSAGTVFSRGIAKWNGTTWSAMGSGMGGINPYVEAVQVYNNELVAGGTFSTAGGVSARGIARWNGTIWQPLGSGVTPPDSSGVYCLAVFNNNLYAGGSFQNAGGVGTNLVASWNGSTWSALGTGILGSGVKTLCNYSGGIVVGGTFYQAGSVAANNIARWSGTTWTTLGGGCNGDVYVVYPVGTNLYVGGLFTYSGGNPTNRIALWNGTTWSSLGVGSANGTNTGVAAITLYPISTTNIVAGGFFLQAGGNAARHIAAWGNFVGITQTGNEIPKDFSLDQNYPNPFNPETKISFSIPRSSQVKAAVYDESGRMVDELVNEVMNAGKYEMTWAPKNLTSGAYFCRVEAGEWTKTIKMSYVK